MVRRLLVLVILAALAAGCTSSNNNGGNGTEDGGAVSPPAQMTTGEARTLLSGAASEMPDRFGMTMTVATNGTQALSVKGAFDNASGEAYVEIKGNASAFGEEVQTGAEFFENGLAIYTTKDGSLYLANGTAFVFPPDESGDGLVPPPDESPLSQFVDPTDAFADFDENTTVQSVTPIVYKGKPAVQLVVTTTQEGQAVNATVVVWTSPKRLAHIEMTMPAQGKDNPFPGGQATIDFAYDNDVAITIPASAKRALGLGYTSNANPFGGSGDEPTVWTFQHSAGIALSEIEVHLKDAAAMGDMSEGGMDYAKVPNKWTMKLSDGSKTQDGVTVAFADKDGDSKVSKNDTLTITTSGNEPATAVLFDTVTKTYVVPGVEVALLIGAVAALATLLRRK